MTTYRRRTPAVARRRMQRALRILQELRARQLVAETTAEKWRREDTEAIDAAIIALRGSGES